MAGNKNSGRKSKLTMLSRAETAADVLVLSLQTLHEVMADRSNPADLRVKAAIPIASKYFPDKVEVKDMNALTNAQRIQLAMRFIEKLTGSVSPPTIDADITA